jgi:hypothetical protein
MTPEERITELENKVQELSTLIANLQQPNSITPEFQNVLDRYGLSSDAKAASSENQAVDEGGAATYNVLMPPNGFDKATIGGTVHYYAYWT